MVWAMEMCERLGGIWQKSSRRKKCLLFLCAYTGVFLATFLLAYSPFLCAGKSFIWIRDGRDAYYPGLVYIGRYLRQAVLGLLHGQPAIPVFDISLALGGDVVSTLNWIGFGDPLNLTAAFVPTRYTEYLYDFLYVYRLYLAGLSFCGLCAYKGKRASHSLVGAVVYVFCGYALYYMTSPFFLNPMIQFPLLLIGMDRILKKQKPYIFIAGVSYSALCGFYFLFMMTVLLALYVLVEFPAQYPSGRARGFLRLAWRTARYYLLGLGMAAITFLPAVLSFLSSSRSGKAFEGGLLSYGWDYYRDNLFKLIAPSGSADTSGTYQPLSVAVVALFALVLLFASKGEGHGRLKVGFLLLMAAYVLPLGGYIMNGFAYPSQRWTFGFVLLLAYITVEMLPALLNMGKKQLYLCFAAMLVYALCVLLDPHSRTAEHLMGAAFLAITLSAVCILQAALPPQPKGRGAGAGLFAVCFCMVFVVGNVSANAVYSFAEGQGGFVALFSKYGEETKRLEGTVERDAEALQAGMEGRFDGASFWRNRGAVWHIPTTWSWWNMTNANLCEFWQRTDNVSQLGMDFKLDGTGQRTITGTLLSTKYRIEAEDQLQYLPYGYSFLQQSKKGRSIYVNDYALPWGYTYDSWIPYEALDAMDGLQREEAMLQSVAIGSGGAPLPEGEVESDIRQIPYEMTGMKGVECEDGLLRVTKSNAEMTLGFEMPAHVEAYLALKDLRIQQGGDKPVDISVECGNVKDSARVSKTDSDWYFGQDCFLLNLGYAEEARASCTITFPAKGTFTLEGIELYALPMDGYPARVEALRAEPLENIEWGADRLSGTVDLSKDKILCVSVPYSAGWTAAVDGEKVEILRGNYMFMCLPLSAGHHDIVFRYHTPGRGPGAVLTLCSAGIVAWMLLRDRKRQKPRR